MTWEGQAQLLYSGNNKRQRVIPCKLIKEHVHTFWTNWCLRMINQQMWHLAGNHSGLLTVSIFEIQVPMCFIRVLTILLKRASGFLAQAESSSQPRIYPFCKISGIPTALCFRPDNDDEEYITSKNIQRAGNGIIVIIHCSFWIIIIIRTFSNCCKCNN